VRALARRVEVVCEPLESYLSRRVSAFDKAALSDAFEYLAAEECDAIFEQLARAIRVGGRLAYWNLLVPRSCPPRLHDRVRPLERLSRALWRRDRAWFYSAFHVETICAA
jgi:S-adenosylmethionine-diacylglycerol 3-amino-3-carboxypropyl transferase